MSEPVAEWLVARQEGRCFYNVAYSLGCQPPAYEMNGGYPQSQWVPFCAVHTAERRTCDTRSSWRTYLAEGLAP